MDVWFWVFIAGLVGSVVLGTYVNLANAEENAESGYCGITERTGWLVELAFMTVVVGPLQEETTWRFLPLALAYMNVLPQGVAWGVWWFTNALFVVLHYYNFTDLPTIIFYVMAFPMYVGLWLWLLPMYGLITTYAVSLLSHSLINAYLLTVVLTFTERKCVIVI